MKRNTLIAYSLVIIACFMIPGPVFARPERMELVSDEQKTKRASAQAKAKAVDLSLVLDPQARLALQALFDAVNLKPKKSGQ